jgi:threonine/homoserine/homoserine lactone efflux protein
MGDAIGQMLPFAVGVAISPMPIVAIVLMLVTPKAKTNGLAFLLGWVVGILIVGTIALLIVNPDRSSESGGKATWVSWLELVLGLLLLLVAVRQWRSRPQEGEEPAIPKWMGALDGLTPVKALGAGMLLSGVNPKNLIFIIGGADAIAQTYISGSQEAIVWLIFMLIASLGVVTPVIIYFVMGERAAAVLEGLKDWMARNNTAIMAVLCVIIAAKLIGVAISGFSS